MTEDKKHQLDELTVSDTLSYLGTRVFSMEECIRMQNKQLTKAKKIVGNLYAICKDNHYPNSSILMEQAEQFLQED